MSIRGSDIPGMSTYRMSIHSGYGYLAAAEYCHRDFAASVPVGYQGCGLLVTSNSSTNEFWTDRARLPFDPPGQIVLPSRR